MTTRAVILARGLGTRMRRADQDAAVSGPQADVAATGVKALIPVGLGRPFLDYVLSALAEAGIREVCLVIGPEHGVIREHYHSLDMARLRVDFVVQHEPRGTADAVLAAEAWTDGHSFLVLNSDNYYPSAAVAALAAVSEPALVAFSRAGLIADGQIAPARFATFALLELDGDYLVRIVEKPGPDEIARLGPDLWVSMNCWRFDERIFAACRSVPLSPRGELELPGAVGLAIAEGRMRVRAVRVDLPVLDLSNRGDIPGVAARLAGIEVRL